MKQLRLNRSTESVTDRITLYVFRDSHFAPAGNTVVSAAPLDAVVKVYGGGGIRQTGGLSSAFGGAAVYRDDSTGEYCLGVWGARKAAKFCNALRQLGWEIEVVNTPPPGRLAWYETKEKQVAIPLNSRASQ
jgi:hypothetical protein